MEDHGGQQETYSLGATVNGTSQTTRLARQMEALIQPQKVLVHSAGDGANGLLGDTGKHGIAQLLEHGRADTGSTICMIQSLEFSLLGSVLHATIMVPATVQAVPPTAAKSMFMESTMLLK